MRLGLGVTIGHQRAHGAGGLGGGAPAWLPAGAVAYADFANSHYYAGGAECALADLLEIGAGSVGAGGLLVQYAGHGDDLAPHLVGDFLAALQVPYTAVLTATDSSTVNGRIFKIHDGDLYYVQLSRSGGNAIQYYGSPDDYNTVGMDALVSPMTPGQKFALALTQNVNSASLSIDGGSVVAANVTGSSTGWSAANYAAFGTDISFIAGDVNLLVESIVIYPPQADADLPALSALT